MFAGLEELLVRTVAEIPARNVLDVGCGTGATSLAIGRALGDAGQCLGIDLSEPMVAAARARAAREAARNVHFVVADAQTHAFVPESVDAIVSRFGVMFFADPVQAFSNLRSAAVSDAALRCIVWRGPEENSFMTTAERALAPLFPATPPRQAGAPGQFAFAEPAYVRQVLEASGWRDVELQAVDLGCTMAGSDLRRYVSRIGPLGRLLPTLDATMQARVIETVLPAFDRFVRGSEVRFDAACWLVCASAAQSSVVATQSMHG
jgi:SAM-dependent methyltransferase